MENSPTIVLVLAGLFGSLAQEDLQRRVFVFPEASDNAHVVVREKPKEPLTNFTLSLRCYTDLTGPYALFSYATQQSHEAILLSKPKPHEYRLSVGGKAVTFSGTGRPAPTPSWEQIQLNWDSTTGLVEFWLNGYPLPRKAVQKGHSIDSQASIVLGQSQKPFGRSFDSSLSFAGELTDVFMWSAVLSPDDLADGSNVHVVCSLVVNWRSLRYDIKGDVMVAPILDIHGGLAPPVTPTRSPLRANCSKQSPLYRGGQRRYINVFNK